ncbi:MAG: hypothetical protein ACI312_03825 [Bacilli bacterium]
MENFLINKIEETIIKETQKQELKENIEKFLEIYTHEPLSILDKNNTNLLNSIFTKLIPDFQNNKSIKNAQEIYIAYKQNGTNGIEDYLIEVNVLLEYLKKLSLQTKETLIIKDIDILENIKNILQKTKLYNLEPNKLNNIIKNIPLTKEEYEQIFKYIEENAIKQINREEILKDTPSKKDLIEEGFSLTFDIAKQVFITEIDKLPTIEEKIQKLDVLINNNIYGNNSNITNSIVILSSILKEEIEEETSLLNELDEEDKQIVKENIDILYELYKHLKEKEESIEEEPTDTYFDYQNHKNKIVYLSNNILKDIDNIEEQKTLKDIYSLLIKIKENNIPLKSTYQKDIPYRKIKRIRSNSNSSQARIICEYLENNTYGIIMILEKKSSFSTKQDNESIKQRIKQYNKDTILNNINEEEQRKIDEQVQQLISSKLKNKTK